MIWTRRMAIVMNPRRVEGDGSDHVTEHLTTRAADRPPEADAPPDGH